MHASARRPHHHHRPPLRQRRTASKSALSQSMSSSSPPPPMPEPQSLTQPPQAPQSPRQASPPEPRTQEQHRQPQQQQQHQQQEAPPQEQHPSPVAQPQLQKLQSPSQPQQHPQQQPQQPQQPQQQRQLPPPRDHLTPDSSLMPPPKTVVGRAMADSHPRTPVSPDALTADALGGQHGLADTPLSTAPSSPQTIGLPKPTPTSHPSGPSSVVASGTSTPKTRATTLDIPGLTKSKFSPDGRIAPQDVGSKLVIVMVGLPARGKSYITKKLTRYLNWLQHDTRIFNVGERRRVVANIPGRSSTSSARRPSEIEDQLRSSVRGMRLDTESSRRRASEQEHEHEHQHHQHQHQHQQKPRAPSSTPPQSATILVNDQAIASDVNYESPSHHSSQSEGSPTPLTLSPRTRPNEAASIDEKVDHQPLDDHPDALSNATRKAGSSELKDAPDESAHSETSQSTASNAESSQSAASSKSSDEDPPDQSASFFDPKNDKASQIREQVAIETLDELLDYILNQGGSIGIFDATNSTIARRQRIMDHIRARAGPDLNVLFLESQCLDKDLLESNMRLKLSGPDYRDQDPNIALADFRQRVALYEKSYVSLGEYEERNNMPYVQMIDVNRKIVTHETSGFLASQVVYYLLNFNLAPRQLWISRHGESYDDAAGRIGGDSPLSPHGVRYAKALTRFINHERAVWESNRQAKALSTHFPPWPGDSTPPNPYYSRDGNAYVPRNFCVWSSMMARCVQTVQYFDDDAFDVKQMRMLDEINAGKFEGKTVDSLRHQFHDEYVERKRQKLQYRYPGLGGESYLDVINRVRGVIIEVERTTDHVLLVSHRSVVRVLLAYFRGLRRDEVAGLDVPLGVLYMIEPKPYGVDFKAYRYNPATDWFDYQPDYEMRQISYY